MGATLANDSLPTEVTPLQEVATCAEGSQVLPTEPQSLVGDDWFWAPPERVVRVGREATAAPYFISEEMGTFSFDWGTLLLSEVQVLWANPPFAILGKVVAKLEEDACRVVLIIPENEEKPWRQPLKKLAKKAVAFPPRPHTFLGGFRKDPLPLRNRRSVAWLIDTSDRARIAVATPNSYPPAPSRGDSELVIENSRIPTLRWTHYHRGG